MSTSTATAAATNEAGQTATQTAISTNAGMADKAADTGTAAATTTGTGDNGQQTTTTTTAAKADTGTAAAADKGPATADKSAAATTTAGDGGNTDADAAAKAAATAAEFPADWREKLAGDDEKLLTALKRFTNPADFAKTFREQQVMLSKKTATAPLAKDATPEQIKEWREANGIPVDATGYDINNLGDGIVVGEDDREMVNGFLGAMHEQNAPPAVVRAALATYYQVQQQAKDARTLADKEASNAAADTLRAEWGGDFRENVNRVANLAESFPEAVRQSFMEARLADGTPIMSSPEVIKTLASWSRQLNPVGTLLPGKGTDTTESIENQIEAYELQMKQPGWHKNEKANKHYMELLGMRERFQTTKK